MHITKSEQGCQIMLDKKEAAALFTLLGVTDSYYRPVGSFEYELVCDLQDAFIEFLEDEKGN